MADKRQVLPADLIFTYMYMQVLIDIDHVTLYIHYEIHKLLAT